MKKIIKNKTKFSFLKKSIDTLDRSHKPVPNIEVLRMYREVLKMTQRFTWNDEDGNSWKEIL